MQVPLIVLSILFLYSLTAHEKGLVTITVVQEDTVAGEQKNRANQLCLINLDSTLPAANSQSGAPRVSL